MYGGAAVYVHRGVTIAVNEVARIGAVQELLSDLTKRPSAGHDDPASFDIRSP